MHFLNENPKHIGNDDRHERIACIGTTVAFILMALIVLYVMVRIGPALPIVLFNA